MRPTLVALFVLLLQPVYAQVSENRIPPNYDAIKRMTTDQSSEYYYPKIFDRYEAGDTTLTMTDYRMLYYGYFFNKKYKSHDAPDGYTDSLRAILEKHVWAERDKKDCIKYGSELLKVSPFDLKYISYLYGAYKELKDQSNAIVYYKKGRMIIGTILSTGDGLTNKTGYHVVTVSDEYTILNVLGYEFGESQSLTEDQCDYLKIKENKDKIEGIYFDVKQMFKSTYADMFKDLKLTLPDDKKKKK